MAPNGKPTTQIGLTRVPASSLAVRPIQVELTQTEAKLCFRASAQTATMSLRVAVGLSRV